MEYILFQKKVVLIPYWKKWVLLSGLQITLQFYNMAKIHKFMRLFNEKPPVILNHPSYEINNI